MKKLFTLLFIVVATGYASAQSSIKLAWMTASMSNTIQIVGNDSAIAVAVPANTFQKSTRFRLQNIGSGLTYTYSVKRYDLTLNSGGSAYFCFGDLGNCFTSATTVCPSTDYAVLKKDSLNDKFVADFDEAPTQGYSKILYKIYNVANPNDSLRFYIKYNPSLDPQLAGVHEITSAIESASDVYPNPSATNASVSVSLKSETDVKLQVYNALGSLVYNGSNQKYAPGKHKLTADCSNLTNGFYFMTIDSGDSKITKRFVINK